MSRYSFAARCLLAFGLAVSSGPLAAQSAPPFSTALDVRLVELEVSVVDEAGSPLRGLTGEDFRLFEDGVEVPIQHLSELGDGAASGGSSSGLPSAAAPAPTHLVVFLDELHTSPSRRAALYQVLREGLTRRLPAGAQVMLARYEGGLQVLLPFTDKRPAIAAAMEQAVGFLSSQAMRGETDRLMVLDAIVADAREGPCLFGDELARQYGERVRADAQQLLRTLDGLVGALDTIPGRKALLYVGDGVPPRPGEEALETYIERCGGEGVARGVPGAKDTATFGEARFHRPDPNKLRLESESWDMGDDWQRLAARANGVGVPLHALTLRAPGSAGESIAAQERGPSAVVMGGAAMAAGDVGALLADETGGRVLIADATVAEQVETVMAPRQGYLLAFAAPSAADPRTRRVRVEVKRPGAQVRHRLSYATLGGDWKMIDRLFAALYLGAGENPLQLRVEAPKVSAAAPRRLRVALPLARLTLLPEGEVAQGRFTVFVVTRDAAGALSAVREKEVPVRLPATGLAAAQQRDFVYEVALPATAVPLEAAVGVRDELSGELAFVRLEL
ncbi:MAG TPA: VWA domain-containing protein [Thermoanaerobaculia bacterium]|nr:VWA domain-containing protein [Thermoanaerobaculia bacterium]